MVLADGTSTIKVKSTVDNSEVAATDESSGITVRVVGRRTTIEYGETGFVLPTTLTNSLADVLHRVSAEAAALQPTE